MMWKRIKNYVRESKVMQFGEEFRILLENWKSEKKKDNNVVYIDFFFQRGFGKLK